MKSKRNRKGAFLPLRSSLVQQALPLSLGLLMATNAWAGTPAPMTTPSTLSIVQQAHTVKGVVKSDDGEALIGVSVRVKGTNRSTMTDNDGRYSIEAPTGATLQFAYIGYERVEVKVTGNQQDVTLKMADNSFDEAVVIGYGTVRKADLSGAVAVMDTKTFKDQPITQVSDALQGRVSGVQVINSGQPGGSVKIRVRGTSSIHNSNDPLYIVDGVVRESGLEGINTEDIQSMQVLKDASSTAIYGSRGANGVVLIQTKTGKAGQAQIIFDASVGFSNAMHMPKMLDAKTYAELLTKYKYNGNAPAELLPYLNGTSKGVDWMDVMLRTGVIQNYKLSLSKGSEDTQIYFSGNYMKQQGVVIGTDMERYTGKLNVNSKIFPWLKLTADVQASHNEGKGGGFAMNGANPLVLALNYSPSMEMYLADGVTFQRDPYNSTSADNPYALMTAIKSERMSNVVNGRVDFAFNLGHGFTFTTTNAVDYRDAKSYGFRPKRMNLAKNNMSNSDYSHMMLQTTNNLTYNNSWGDHHLTATAVYEAMKTTTRSIGISGSDLRAESVGYWDVNNAATITASNGYSAYSLLSGVGRVIYNYADRYMATATFRADGSSRFSKKKWGYFPSISGTWTVSNEAFFAPMRKTISNLKVRASYGIIGNQNISPYSTLGLLSSTRFNFGTGTEYTGYQPNSLATPELTWEKTHQFDFGVDLGLFDNRVEVTLDIFSKRTSDALLQRHLTDYLGGTPYWVNAGEVSNKGIDLGITAHILRNDDWNWTSTLNLSYNKNKVVSLTSEEPIIYGTSPAPGTVDPVSIVKVGEAIGTFYGYVWEGIDADGKDVYTDFNKNNKIDADDRRVLGKANPDVTIGWNNTVRWKQWEFNAFLNASFGAKRLNLVRFMMNAMPGASMFVTDADYLANMGVTMPRLDAVGNLNYGNSSKWIENADYLRMENISLAYNLSKSQTHFADIRFSLSVQNLFTITGYKGSDPAGFSFGNKDYENGVDMGTFPASRTITLGARFTF